MRTGTVGGAVSGTLAFPLSRRLEVFKYQILSQVYINGNVVSYEIKAPMILLTCSSRHELQMVSTLQQSLRWQYLLPWIGESLLEMMTLLGRIFRPRRDWRCRDREGIEDSRGGRAHIAPCRECSTTRLLAKEEDKPAKERRHYSIYQTAPARKLQE